MKYFNWKQFKRFLKQIRRTKMPVRFYAVEDSTVKILPPREISDHLLIIDRFSMVQPRGDFYHISLYGSRRVRTLDIPTSASLITNDYTFGYEWKNWGGRTTYRVLFYRVCPKGNKAYIEAQSVAR